MQLLSYNADIVFAYLFYNNDKVKLTIKRVMAN